MSLFDFSEQYYQNLAHNYLLLLLDTLLKNDIAITFDNTVRKNQTIPIADQQ